MKTYSKTSTDTRWRCGSGSLVLLVVTLCLTPASVWAAADGDVNYCDQSLCRSNYTHIGCNATESFGVLCPAGTVQLVQMDQPMKDLILKLHNSLRSELASGKMTGFAEAERMAVLEWDDELAKLAEYNARTCHYLHDECRSTKRYRNAGQNIGRKSRAGNVTVDLEQAVTDLTNKWWQEYVETNQTVMDNYRPVGEGVDVGHFARMASDRVTKVGCGATRYYNVARKRSNVYYVCNYSYSPELGQPVYRKGTQCSKCGADPGAKCSSTYAGLCEGIGDTIDKEL
ncbi:antigen 5 like allergen Cul n 1-like [Anopheles ziemanni]|uniref:antigen 5 like allergen Cul n 1-like n=1 Tax=Anopheles coustani TaxID=139045 RepID=UPI002659F6AB|nr:antigen 5 like allergen Cul n 1-like [Anopheles coustani]XP_058169137.1 antigen 5 like allergen Cul n 1-like [Anopheles ziemanni]